MAYGSEDARALVRLQCDHVNRTLVPAFYRYLQAQEEEAQIKAGKEFHDALYGLVELLERAEQEVVDGGGFSSTSEKKTLGLGLGLWIEGNDLGLTDVMVGPCMYECPIFPPVN
jgi:glutathione S-transferase